MSREISNSDDIINSRDVIARLEELSEERERLADALEEAKEAHETIPDPEWQAPNDLSSPYHILRPAQAPEKFIIVNGYRYRLEGSV